MNDNFLNSSNAPYVAELYSKYCKDPNSVDENWNNFFDTLNEDEVSILKDFGGPTWKNRPSNVIENFSLNSIWKLNSKNTIEFQNLHNFN